VKIRELRNGMRGVDVEGVIKSKGEVRNIVTRYGPARVVDAVLEDDTGEIVLTLWNENVDAVEEGDKVKIVNGYTSVFRGRLQLNIGRRGSIIVLD